MATGQAEEAALPEPDGEDSSNRLSLSGQIVLRVAAFAWIGILAMAIPSRGNMDYGVFVSVAERLLAGDRLYADVWDNKDPVFYYVLALSRSVPYLSVLTEVMWLAVAAYSAFLVMKGVGVEARTRGWIAAVVVPLILVGGAHWPGYTHLPGTSLSLLAAALVCLRRNAAAGAVLGLLLFTKLTTFPVACLVVGIFWVLRRDWRGAVRGLVGAAAAIALVVLVMAIRGELVPYFGMLERNFTYASEAGGPVAHLWRVFGETWTWSIPIITAVLLVEGWIQSRERPQRRQVWWAALLATVGGLFVLALTGMWQHHAQMLALGAVLALVVTIPRRIGLAAGVLILISGVLAGGVREGKLEGAVASSYNSLSGLEGPTAASARLAAMPAVKTYARVGTNDDQGHAVGLRHLELKCPGFHHYPFDPPEQLYATAECIRGADALLVSDAIAPGGGAAWNEFVSRVEVVLADYDCEKIGHTRLCLRRDLQAA